ncbi:MAG: methionine ABC transporter ATP-binding protein [Fretibacterium sp.]|nr:methionine ABC transporter ATP-binding protein [Fretibacterium sp.]
MIELQNVSKEFDLRNESAFHALKNVSLSIRKGSIFGIIGRSGAGKSTLVRLINLLEIPTSGTVRVGGVDMTSLSPVELRVARRKIGMIFQGFNLLSSRSVADNVAFPLELEGRGSDEIKGRVSELLELVDLSGKKDEYPAQLSGGQKQRVGIARALAANPDILLCDEATSALDPQTTTEVLALLKEINRKLGLTVVLITHEMSVIKEICEEVVVLDRGEVVESGAVFQVFTRPQSPVTRALVAGVMNQEIPPHFAALDFLQEPEGDCGLLVRVSFLGDTAAEPIISGMVRRFGIDVNILYGAIDHIQGVPFGTLIVELSGNGSRNAALDYLKNLNLGLEVIGYVRRNLESSL